jgi:hypothetical protein
MTEELNVGDVIRLNGTDQEGEVLEVIHVHTGEPGPLLRVQLHDTGTRKAKTGKFLLPEIVYWTANSVMLVTPAAEKGKKANHEKAEHEKKAEHGKK